MIKDKNKLIKDISGDYHNIENGKILKKKIK